MEFEKPIRKVDKDGNEAVYIDGFKQVLQMLSVAEPQFRESLLKRIAQKDPELARKLRRQFI